MTNTLVLCSMFLSTRLLLSLVEFMSRKKKNSRTRTHKFIVANMHPHLDRKVSTLMEHRKWDIKQHLNGMKAERLVLLCNPCVTGCSRFFFADAVVQEVLHDYLPDLHGLFMAFADCNMEWSRMQVSSVSHISLVFFFYFTSYKELFVASNVETWNCSSRNLSGFTLSLMKTLFTKMPCDVSFFLVISTTRSLSW